MVIPYARTYTATMKGASLKAVQCEGCRAEYLYRYEASSSGSDTSLLFLNNAGARNRARELAERALEKQLERGVDAVPCPQCGHFQANMLRIVRKGHQRWMFNCGGWSLVVAIIAFIVSMASVSARGPSARLLEKVSLGCAIGLAAGGFGLIITRVVLAAQFQPNAGPPESRLALARDRAILRKDFEALLAARASGGSADASESADASGQRS